MKTRVFIVAVMAFGIALVATLYRAAGTGPAGGLPAELQGTVWAQPRAIGEFDLRDHRGEPFGRAELLGHWTLMFFGYASCPDICPATMQTLAGVTAALSSAGATTPRVVLVSVDPERDDAASLGRYVSTFDEAFLGIRGEDNQLRALALQVGSTWSRDAPDAAGNYEVAHSAAVFLLDPRARVYAAFLPPLDPKAMAEKLNAITAYYARETAAP